MASIVTADLAQRLLDVLLPAPVRSSAAALVVANLVPLYGVMFWDWPLFHVMALYWAENVVAGVVTLARMLHAHPIGGLFTGAFFCVHYGMFCFVHGVFVGTLFSPGAKGAFELEPLRQAFLTEPTLLIAAALLATSHGWSFVAHTLHGGETGAGALQRIMMRPYKRMVALHVAIIFGGFAILSLGVPVLALVILIVLKTGIDLRLHARAHTPRPEDVVPPVVATPVAPAPNSRLRPYEIGGPDTQA